MYNPIVSTVLSVAVFTYIIYGVLEFIFDYKKINEHKEWALIISIIAILPLSLFFYNDYDSRASHSYDDFDYSVNVSGSSITIKVPYPSTGLVGVGITSLHVEPSKIGNDILSEFQGIKGLFKSGEYTAQLYLVSPDSYGGIIETGPYVLFSAQASELNKFENYRYFNKAFDFENKIYQSANR